MALLWIECHLPYESSMIKNSTYMVVVPCRPSSDLAVSQTSPPSAQNEAFFFFFLIRCHSRTKQ